MTFPFKSPLRIYHEPFLDILFLLRVRTLRETLWSQREVKQRYERQRLCESHSPFSVSQHVRSPPVLLRCVRTGQEKPMTLGGTGMRKAPLWRVDNLCVRNTVSEREQARALFPHTASRRPETGGRLANEATPVNPPGARHRYLRACNSRPTDWHIPFVTKPPPRTAGTRNPINLTITWIA